MIDLGSAATTVMMKHIPIIGLALIHVACAGAIDPSRFEQDACRAYVLPAFGSFVLPDPADYIEVRYHFPTQGVQGPRKGVSFGTPCVGASTTACEEALAAAASTQGWPAGPNRTQYLVVTRGEEVALVDTLDELRELLGVVDSAPEAIFLAESVLDGALVCKRYGEPVNNVAGVGDGWELFIMTGTGCGAEAVDAAVSVMPDGKVEILESVVVADANDLCGG